MKTLLSLLVLALTLLPVSADGLKIVAAENFYGGVATQIAGPGPDVKVTSIMSNPNQDPHEFTTNASTAKAVADADVVIYSGIGYDDWMEKLLGAGGKRDRVVICVADLIGAKNGDNPHIWYDPKTMPALANRLAVDLTNLALPPNTLSNLKRDPFPDRARAFDESMQPVRDEIALIKKDYPNVAVTATEPVFGYMAKALDFKMLNYDFQVNIMNDTEPSAAQTAAFQRSLSPKIVKILFYNKQVTDPTTERLKKLALQSGVPIVGVTETQPLSAKTYVDWMMHELKLTENALALGSGFRDLDPWP